MQPEQEVNESGAPVEPSVAPLHELPILSPIFPREEREPFWGYFDLLLIVGLIFASMFLVVLLAGGWIRLHPNLKPESPEIAFPMQFAIYALVYLCFSIVFKLRYNCPVLPSLGWRKTHFNLLGVGLGGILLAIAIDVVAPLIHTPKVATPFDELVKTPFSMAIMAFLAVLIGPFFEEMVFRGFLQPLFSRSLGTALGILITAFLFGGLHGSEYQWAWQYVAAITVVGIALGVLRQKTNSIIPTTVMHGCFNSVSVVGIVLQKYLIHK
jgi:membrane protease YdiL (CAAX protease family)